MCLGAAVKHGHSFLRTRALRAASLTSAGNGKKPQPAQANGRTLRHRPDSAHLRCSRAGWKAGRRAVDPSAGVRLRNLSFLVEPRTRTPRALLESTARALLTDPDIAVRLLAAAQLGPEGGPVFLALLSDPEQEAEPRIAALRALDASGALGPELLERVLRTEPTELVCVTLSVIARRRLTELCPQVVACTHSTAQLRQAARAAIGRIQGRLGNVEAGRVSLTEASCAAPWT